ncbi:MAG: serine/threonine protein kinase [Pirellulaceae bacterium]|nr:serine/threonine protein kinase [Pirellulaceae bacterium]
MGSPARSVFRNSALVSGLVTPAQLEQAETEVRRIAGGPPTPAVEISDSLLSAQLVAMGVLTSYQADQLRAGRTKLTLGPYTITDWIGQGGMGQVFKAVHQVMGRQCAIKVLPLNKSTPQSIASFIREIRTQAQLDHAHLVRAYDAGNDGKVHYLVTEYVPGTDLRRLVRTHGPLTIQKAANVILQAAQALQHAHARGLIHRDVKPGNILVTPDGVAKVSDLGLSACMHNPEEDPRAGRTVGTPDYLSPEQIRSPLEVGPASDIYSLGCTLYYAITGKVPFPGGSTADKARRHLEETPWHPRRFNPDINEEFVEIIADMMEKDPHRRIQTAAEVVARLEPWASDVGPIVAQLTKSPWLPPPLPTDEDDLAEAEILFEELTESPSQSSQTTDAVAAANQETVVQSGVRRRATPPPVPPAEYRHQRAVDIALALAIAIPISLAIGTIAGFVLRSVLG